MEPWINYLLINNLLNCIFHQAMQDSLPKYYVLCYNRAMQFEVFTLLPEVFPSYLDTSILKRARERGLITVNVHNIRDYTHDKHPVSYTHLTLPTKA